MAIWKSIIEILVQMAVWTTMYYYIRRRWNPGSYGENKKRTTEKALIGKGGPEDYWGDAVYGGVASGFIFAIRRLVFSFLKED